MILPLRRRVLHIEGDGATIAAAAVEQSVRTDHVPGPLHGIRPEAPLLQGIGDGTAENPSLPLYTLQIPADDLCLTPHDTSQALLRPLLEMRELRIAHRRVAQ
ncbi:hypothetical protein ACE0DR_20860 [Azotobacter sp. CWF10]